MTFAGLNLLFPVVLAIHNADEYSRYDEFVGAYQGRLARKLTARPAVRNAATLLTLSAAVLDMLTYVSQSYRWMAIARVAVFALMFNGLGHCVSSFFSEARWKEAISQKRDLRAL